MRWLAPPAAARVLYDDQLPLILSGMSANTDAVVSPRQDGHG